MTIDELYAAANAIALAAWKLMHTVETNADDVPDDVLSYARELRAVSAEWVVLPAPARN